MQGRRDNGAFWAGAGLGITRMHKDEVIRDAAFVRRLVAEQFPAWGDMPVVAVPSSGTDNAMFRLGDDLVVRMPRRPGGGELVLREHRWLPHLAPHLPVEAPVPVALGRPAMGYPFPWLVIRWIEGVNPVVGGTPDPHRLARDIAAFIRAMREIDPAGGPPTGLSLSERDAQVRADIDALGDEIDVPAVTAIWDDALALPRHEVPMWVHGDVAPGNLLLVDGRLHGVIDFSGSGVGDLATDLQVAWNLLPAEVRSTLREALGVDAPTWRRARARALAQALVQLPYYKETNIPLATNARHVLREVTTEWRAEGR